MQVKGDLNLQQIEGSFDKILGMLQERYSGYYRSLARNGTARKRTDS